MTSRNQSGTRPERRSVRRVLAVAALCTLPVAALQPARAEAPGKSTSILDRVSSAPLPDPREQVLVPGKSPLTAGMVDGFARFMEWVLDAPLTAGQRAEVQEMLVQGFRKGDPATINGTAQFLKLREQVFALPVEQRELLRARVQPELLQQWRAQREDPSAQWMLSVYDAAHKPLAPGKPALTRQVADAYAETLCFMVTEVSGKPVQADAKYKSEFAASLAKLYGQWPAEQQEQLQQLPLLWAALRAGWPQMPEADRAKLREQWKGVLAQIFPPSKEQAELDALGKELAPFEARLRSGGKLTPAELRQAAGTMRRMSAVLTAQGDAGQAQTWSGIAAKLEAQATAASQPAAGRPAPPANSQEAYARAMAALQSQHSAYVGMSNALTINHVGSMNAIAIMGNSPYRYSYK